MYVKVDGARLFFDCENAAWYAEGAQMRRRPTLLMLHGGPGIDHSIYREAGKALADEFHVVYLDHRGNGRSDRGDPADWTLARWADDVKGFCDALGIEQPIVLGSSFGGYVAQAYAAAHPDHAGGIVLVGTAPRFVRARCVSTFRRLGGERAASVADAYFRDPAAGFPAYFGTCFPLYAKTAAPPEIVGRMVLNLEVAHHFVGGEMARFDLRAGLAAVRAPTLVLSADDDVIATPADIEELVAALVNAPVRHVAFRHSGHEILADAGPAAFEALRAFARGLHLGAA